MINLKTLVIALVATVVTSVGGTVWFVRSGLLNDTNVTTANTVSESTKDDEILALLNQQSAAMAALEARTAQLEATPQPSGQVNGDDLA